MQRPFSILGCLALVLFVKKIQIIIKNRDLMSFSPLELKPSVKNLPNLQHLWKVRGYIIRKKKLKFEKENSQKSPYKILFSHFSLVRNFFPLVKALRVTTILREFWWRIFLSNFHKLLYAIRKTLYESKEYRCQNSWYNLMLKVFQKH